MKNSSAYSGDAFAFFKQVCRRKRDQPLKNRLALMDPNIQLLYNQYDLAFAANSLEDMIQHGYVDPNKADLETLYNYDSQALSRLRTELTTTPFGRIVKCQNCTINDAHTFDHLVPKTEFVEFNVHPKNLFCSCGDCNSRKGSIWRNGGVRTSLNLYIDQLPNLQYLFVTADVSNTTIDVEFRVENPNGIDPQLFALIEEHYQRLDLCRRFRESSNTPITSLKSNLEPMRILGNPVLARNLALESVRLERLSYGHNFWQSVLKYELLISDDFMIDFA